MVPSLRETTNEATQLHLKCSKCGTEAFPSVVWQLPEGGGRLLRANCSCCGSYIKYLRQVSPFIELAAPMLERQPTLFEDTAHGI
ncbi:hypothetical protein D3C72_731870 [compost metagenome]